MGGQPVPRVIAPGTAGIKFNVPLPVFARLRASSKLLAHERQIVMRVRIPGIEPHRQTQVLPRLLQLAHLF